MPYRTSTRGATTCTQTRETTMICHCCRVKTSSRSYRRLNRRISLIIPNVSTVSIPCAIPRWSLSMRWRSTISWQIEGIEIAVPVQPMRLGSVADTRYTHTIDPSRYTPRRRALWFLHRLPRSSSMFGHLQRTRVVDIIHKNKSVFDESQA